MSNVKIRALMGASALVMAAGAAATAQAQTQVYGGGSTLSAPYVRQAEDCFGLQTPLFTPGKAATNPPTESYDGTNCATTQQDPNVQINLEASGSGAGVQAFFEHNPVALGAYIPVGGTTANTTFPFEHYGTSDTAMGEADVAVYNGGGVVEPATGKTVNVVASGVTPATGQYANPQATYGAMVQVPLLITPITVAFSPVYKKVLQSDGVTVKTYSFNITNAANKGSLRLDLPTYCKIFNGQITNWNDPAIAALNGTAIKVKGVVTGYTPINDPADPDAAANGGAGFSLPIELVGRSDGSGTTSIFSRALAAQCTGISGVTNKYPDAASTLPSALISTTQPATPGSGTFTVQSGSGGVATYMQFTAVPTTQGVAGEVVSGKIAYLSPDYVGPVNTTYGLTYAALSNLASETTGPVKFVLPTAKAALASFGAISAPTGSAVADPAAWVQAPSKTAAIATPTSTTGYPLVGTTQLLAYTCYADTAPNSDINIGYKMNRFLYFYLKNPIVAASNGILYTYGFAPLPSAFRTAEYNAFVLPSTATAANPYYISSKSDLIQTSGTKTKITWQHNTACDTVHGG